MHPPVRSVIRLAAAIREQLAIFRQHQDLRWAESLKYFVERLHPLNRIHHQLGLCQQRGYHAAARRLHDHAVRLLPDLIHEVEAIQQMDRRRPLVAPPLRDLVEEIQQIEQEFGTNVYDRKTQVFSVTTDPIELEGIELGPFRIDLHLDALALIGTKDVYHVEALEPHPAATDSGVTHPHVSHGRLCEGDSAAPIRAALQQGCLCDFFLLVRSVLQTYNPHSPYVSLNNWESQPCYDCGYHMSEDDRYSCESCDHEFCDECVSYCRHCDRSICRGCLVECPHCQDRCCERCIDMCAKCRQTCCPSCLEDDLCPTCKEEQERNNDEQEQQEEPRRADDSSRAA